MAYQTILLVEDDRDDERLTLRALRVVGVPNSVVVAHTGQEALAFLRRSGPFHGRRSPDPLVIFVDNSLPGLSGVDLIAAIREVPSTQHVPVVVLSGSSDQKVMEGCARAGANSFLEKPMDMTDYIEQVRAAARYWLTLNLTPHPLQGRASAL